MAGGCQPAVLRRAICSARSKIVRKRKEEKQQPRIIIPTGGRVPWAQDSTTLMNNGSELKAIAFPCVWWTKRLKSMRLLLSVIIFIVLVLCWCILEDSSRPISRIMELVCVCVCVFFLIFFNKIWFARLMELEVQRPARRARLCVDIVRQFRS